MVEIEKIDFTDERALRAWCIETVYPRLNHYELDEALSMAEKIYQFVSGGKEIEITIKDGETVEKITVPTDKTGTKINLAVVR